MKKRIGNDFEFIWIMKENGVTIDVSTVLNYAIKIKHRTSSLVVSPAFSIVNGSPLIECSAHQLNEIGSYYLIASWRTMDDSFADGFKDCVADVDSFDIVSRSSMEDLDGQTVTSEICLGFTGQSAYDIWHEDNPDGTLQDFYDWIRQPATDAAVLADEATIRANNAAQAAEDINDIAIPAEQGRIAAELVRVSSENTRLLNEQGRVSAEDSRVTVEGQRVIAEQGRSTAEGLRVTAEQGRTTAEGLRVTAEQNRDTAEGVRVSSEITRGENEAIRVSQEAARVIAEQARVDAGAVLQTQIKQVTGTSETDVMSQKAVTDELDTKADHGYVSTPKTLKEVEDIFAAAFADSPDFIKYLYKNRVVADSGTVIDESSTLRLLKESDYQNTLKSVRFAWFGDAGVKQRTSGINKHATKIYSLDSAANDATQTTESSQPFISGNIAQNENLCLKQATGGTRTLTHPSITFTGTVTIVQKTDQTGKAIVTHTDLTAATRSSITINGRLYAYIIRDEFLTSDQKAAEYNLLAAKYPEIPSVTIGEQEWATSNLEMVATPEGNVIANVTDAANVEMVTNAADREFSSDTGWWTKIGETTINSGGNGVANIKTTSSEISAITRGSLLTIGSYYRLEYTITRAASGSIRTGMTGVVLPLNSSFGSYVYYLKSSNTTFDITREASNTDIDIDNISLQKVGWSDLSNMYAWLISPTGGNMTEYDALKECAGWCYKQNDLALGAIYGKQYNAYGKNLLAADIATQADWGWHISTEAELTALALNSGLTLKVGGTDYWTTDNGTNTTGLTVLGGGTRNATTGAFEGLKANTAFWCADSDKVLLILDDGTATITSVDKTYGAYIRLIKDI